MAFRKQSGLSLIELLVAMTVGIFTVGAALSVLSVSEGRKRTTSSVNDINQAGTYAVYKMDQAIRSSGTGFGQNTLTNLGLSSAYGCLVNSKKNGNKILPNQPLPSPFDKTSGNIRLAPVLIKNGAKNTGGDVIISMYGTSGLAELPTKFSSTGSTNSTLYLDNIVNFMANDKVLLVGAANSNCFVSQIDSNFTASEHSTAIALNGTYYAAKIRGLDISSANSYLLNLGQSPQFKAFAVGSNSNLYSYNFFEPANTLGNNPNPNIIVNNVDQLQAIYGVEIAGVFQWVQPTGDYAMANVNNDISKMASIKAIKLALIMKTDQEAKENVTQDELTLFSDTNQSVQVSIPASDRHYRYQVFETTIPVRNNLN